MTESTLLLATDARGIAAVTLNRPEVHNALDDYLVNQLTFELKRLGQDAAVRAVVLSGRGASFCAGADIHWMRRMADYSLEQNLQDARALAELMHTLNELPKPTIARVQGPVYGGGVGLVACCDVAIAAASATFQLSEVRLGLIPAVISPYVVNAMGERQARRYFITAEPFTAAEAQRLGLIHEAVAAADLDGRVERLLEALTGNGPAAMVAAKDLVRAVSRGPVDAALIDDTARRIATVRASAEGREGLSAFLNKRRPAWRND